MMWFDKTHKNVVFGDVAVKPEGCIEQQRYFKVIPDVLLDFRNLPFIDNSFDLVAFDPPHIIDCKETSIMWNKYGSLDPGTFRFDLLCGFNECWRVLRDSGTLVFKWAESRLSTKDVLDIFPVEPMFGHTTGRSGTTKWFCFMKVA